MSSLAGELLAGYSVLNEVRKQVLADETARIMAEQARGMDLIRADDERVGAAMLAHALMQDDAALELLAGEHEDPARLAAAVARSARLVLVMVASRPDQSNLFKLEEPHRAALRLAMDGAAANI
jgi:hypothetical protein